MVRFVLGLLWFSVSLILGGLVLTSGADAGLSPVQGSLLLFVCLVGVWQSAEFISREGR